jgi:hypothetical protein
MGHPYDTNMVLSTEYDKKGWEMSEKLRRYEK